MKRAGETISSEPTGTIGAIAAGSSVGGITYALHTLGWGYFQSLCSTILREILGQVFQTFAESGDAGRDGGFFGKWKPQGGEEMRGSFVAQCKFTARAGGVLHAGDLNDELTKARKLAKKGLAQHYLLLTNFSLRGPIEDELRSRFLRIRGIKSFTAFGSEWITQQIRENQKLRTLVPRLYGLGDLTEILDERVYEHAKEILSWLGDDLERFVVTDSHYRSVQALREKGFVFLLGDAGSGKSTIAAALALAAADTWRSRVIKVRHADDFTAHWNPREPNQFFWMDDAFGQRQYERERALEWNHALPHLSAAIRRGARVIFTSRSYIYKAAVEDLKESIFPLLKESRVVIEVEKLTQKEREQILYNHLRLGGQPAAFRSAVKAFLPKVAAHEKFLPEIARRLGDPFFTKKLQPDLDSVFHFVAASEEYLCDLIEGLGDANRAALGLAFMRGGKLRAGLELSVEESRALQLMNSTVGAVRKSLNALEGSLVVLTVEAGENVYRLKHPTIRDAFGKVIGNDPNLMDIFLRGTRVEQLLHEITCGDVGLEGVKLVVPADRFEIVVERLREHIGEPGGPKRIASFLTSRCSVDFLRSFMRAEPSFPSKLKLNAWLLWSEEAKLFGILFQHNLLNELQRRRFVLAARESALSTPEWRFMHDAKIRSIFRPSELRSLRAALRQQVDATRLNRELKWWKSRWEQDNDEDPGDYFWTWERELHAFSQEFIGNRTVRRRFIAARKNLDRMIEELKRDWKEKEGDIEAADDSEKQSSERSIFEDVDA